MIMTSKDVLRGRVSIETWLESAAVQPAAGERWRATDSTPAAEQSAQRVRTTAANSQQQKLELQPDNERLAETAKARARQDVHVTLPCMIGGPLRVETDVSEQQRRASRPRGEERGFTTFCYPPRGGS